MTLQTRMDVGQLPVLALSGACIALNVGIGSVVFLTKAPVYIDSIGIVVAALLIPGSKFRAFWYAAIVAVISFVLGGLLVNPFLPYFVLTGIAGAAYGAWVVRGRVDDAIMQEGETTKKGGLLFKIVILGIGWGVLAAFMSAPVVVYLFGGVTGSGTALIVAFFVGIGNQLLKAAIFSGLTAEPVDKTIQLMCAIAIVRATPASFLRALGRSSR